MGRPDDALKAGCSIGRIIVGVGIKDGIVSPYPSCCSRLVVARPNDASAGLLQAGRGALGTVGGKPRTMELSLATSQYSSINATFSVITISDCLLMLCLWYFKCIDTFINYQLRFFKNRQK